MDNQRAISIIQDYILDFELPGRDFWSSKRYRPHRLECKQDRFDQRSNYHWAAVEVMNYVMVHNDMSPIRAIEEFEHKMARYARKNKKTEHIFSAARDVADDILDILCAAR